MNKRHQLIIERSPSYRKRSSWMRENWGILFILALILLSGWKGLN